MFNLWTNLLQEKCFFWERETIFCLTGFSFCSVFLWCTWWLRENSFAMITSVVIKNVFQKYISRYLFSFFQTVFYCRRCKLFTLLRSDYGSWHWLYYWLNYFRTYDRGIVGIVKERNVSGGIKRRRSTWLVLQCVLVIVPGRILRYLAVAAAQQTLELRAKTGSDTSLFTLSLPIHAPLLF